jgi:hypothetical protein
LTKLCSHLENQENVLWTDENFPVVDGVVEGHLDDRDTKWERIFLDRKVLAMYLGDPTSGPSLVIVDIPPKSVSGDQSPLHQVKAQTRHLLPDFVRRPLRSVLSLRGGHFHRSDTFRMVLGKNSEHSFSFGRQWHRVGDYRLQSANVRYREWHGDGGCLELIIDSDRRGHPPIDSKIRASSDPEVIRDSLFGAGSYVSNLQEVHTRNEDAVSGLGSTFLRGPSRAGFSGSFRKHRWATLSDGSRIAGIVMGDRLTGPMLVLSHNKPGVAEAPAGAHSTEVLRFVLEGTCTIGDRSYGPGAWRMTDAGVVEGPVVHGPEGSTQLVLFADRRGWIPDAAVEGSARESDARFAEIAAVLAPLTPAMN